MYLSLIVQLLFPRIAAACFRSIQCRHCCFNTFHYCAQYRAFCGCCCYTAFCCQSCCRAFCYGAYYIVVLTTAAYLKKLDVFVVVSTFFATALRTLNIPPYAAVLGVTFSSIFIIF